jgi:aquaporin NIP
VKEFVLRRCLAEGLGTALLVGLGTAAIVASVRVGFLSIWLIALAWFFAVTLPILLFVRTSGAHLNPAVTLALAASGRIGWEEVAPYVASQIAGAFLGSASVLLLLGDYGSLGATVPFHGDLGLVFLGEALFTAVLVSAVFFLADRGAQHPRFFLLLPGLVVFVSTVVIGPLSGSSLNPARTIAPGVLSGNLTDIWLYLIAVPFGSLVVAGIWKPRAVDRLERGPGRLEGEPE